VQSKYTTPRAPNPAGAPPACDPGDRDRELLLAWADARDAGDVKAMRRLQQELRAEGISVVAIGRPAGGGR